ncbi:predicted protein [Naegleria gruberi]|uniref:Predicted protein n=1 Tax=Naegleria gruberi TaxID=5762 RepID=D2V602_NAEGR|nr:uncharacterized protein NAEGRDRAFT_64263 [Naegleria gruberi]EFC47737.1 predicted protein [Naegleria gruberi]|eukprot:XP_002680481.1 predicted protein [Naegleria gruberi strain NEG-M]
MLSQEDLNSVNTLNDDYEKRRLSKDRIKKQARKALIDHQRLKHFKTKNFLLRRVVLPFSEIEIERLAIYMNMEFNNYETIFESVKMIRLFSAGTDLHFSWIVKAGITKYLVDFLDVKYVSRYFNIQSDENFHIDDSSITNRISTAQLLALQYESVRSLTNIGRRTIEYVQHIVDLGCVPKLIMLVNACNDSEMQYQSILALDNINQNSHEIIEFRDTLLSHGYLDILINFINSNNNQLERIRNVTYSISILLSRNYTTAPVQYFEKAIPILSKMLHQSEISDGFLWDFSLLTDVEPAINQLVITSDTISKLVALLSDSSIHNQIPASRTISNICTDNTIQTEIALNSGLLEKVSIFLTSENNLLIREAFYILSSIPAEQIEGVVVNSKITPLFLETSKFNDNLFVKPGLFSFIETLCCRGNHKIINHLINLNVIEILHSGLCDEFLRVCLETLSNILQVEECKERAIQEMKHLNTFEKIKSEIQNADLTKSIGATLASLL